MFGHPAVLRVAVHQLGVALEGGQAVAELVRDRGREALLAAFVAIGFLAAYIGALAWRNR